MATRVRSCLFYTRRNNSYGSCVGNIRTGRNYNLLPFVRNRIRLQSWYACKAAVSLGYIGSRKCTRRCVRDGYERFDANGGGAKRFYAVVESRARRWPKRAIRASRAPAETNPFRAVIRWTRCRISIPGKRRRVRGNVVSRKFALFRTVIDSDR